MLKISAAVTNIDYESTLNALFPVLSDKLSTIESRNLAVRVLRQLGDSAQPVAVNVLRRVPDDMKNRLAVAALNAYSPALTKKINELLRSKIGNGLVIGSITAELSDNVIKLTAYQVNVNYPTLLRSDFVRALMNKYLGGRAELVNKVGKMAFLLAPAALEKLVLDYVCQGANKRKLVSAGQDVLDKHGVSMQLSDIQIEQSAAGAPQAPNGSRGLSLTEEHEDALIAAAAGYLKDTIRQ